MHTLETVLIMPLTLALITVYLGRLPQMYRQVSERGAAETKACIEMLDAAELYVKNRKGNYSSVVTHPPRLLRFGQTLEDLFGPEEEEHGS